MAEEEIKEEFPEKGTLPPLRIEKGRTSYNGLKALAGIIEEDCNRDLRWPQCMTTYKAMLKDATISSSLNLMEMQLAKVRWTVKIPEGYEEELKDKARFLESCKDDMDHSWTDFIRQASSFNRFGFAPVEKVYRKRTRANGSRFNDGLYGIKELPLITQDSVAGWEWDDKGRRLIGLAQYRNIPTGIESKDYTYTNQTHFIRREKFMLFRADPLKDSPIGTSPLNNVYMAWRYKTEMERQQALGVSTDVRGMKVIYLPPQYMSDNASPEEKETYEAFQKALALMHSGEQSGLILPRVYDDNGKPLFEFEVKSVLGSATYDVSEIIAHYRREIVSGLMTPITIIGQDGSGSFALAEALEDITATIIEARLTEIRDTLNHDLVRQLFMINGWDTSVMPYFDYDITERESLEEVSKYIQRTASVGLMPKTIDTVNWITTKMGLNNQFNGDESQEDFERLLTGYESGASEGLAVGTTGEGTSKAPSGRDSSIANMENA